MRHLFYELVVRITSIFIELDNNELQLSTVGTQIKMSNNIALWVGIIYLIVSKLVIALTVETAMTMYKNKKIHSC